MQQELTDKEKHTLYGLVRYPLSTDKHLAKLLSLKHSTITAIRQRLHKGNFYRSVVIPRLQNLGCKMLVVIYTNFSPLIPLEERVRITGKTIEVFEEIFFSAGEQEKGFSLSLSKDYATIGRINDIRTQTFGGRGLLENEYPNMVVFPFEISRIYRFFDFAPLLNKHFSLNIPQSGDMPNFGTVTHHDSEMTETEKNVYTLMVKYPEESDTILGGKLGISRHTISRLRRGFEQQMLIRRMNLPNLKNLGFEILSFYHIRFDPRRPHDLEDPEIARLMSDSTIFFASRLFEAIMISVHRDYDEYKQDSTQMMQVLKEKKWVAENPLILTYSLSSLIIIKDFAFAPLAKKIVGCTLDLKSS